MDNIRILVADDFPSIRSLLKSSCKSLGFENVDEAASGQQTVSAISKAQTKGKPYTLIFLDWNMPDITGYDVLKMIRADPILKDTKVIMVTAEKSSEQVIASAKAGVNGYIIKPFNANEIKNKIEVALNIQI